MIQPSRPRRGALVFGAIGVFCGCNASEEVGSIELSVTPYEVPVGAEMLRCQELSLPSDSDVEIVRVTSSFSTGNHHVHVYVSADGSTGGPEKTYDCFQTVDFSKWHLLVAAQASGLDWALPEGTAIHVKGRQSILIQTHYLNFGAGKDGPMIAEGKVALELSAPGDVRARVAAIAGENRAIDLPPYTTGRVEGECALPGNGEILAMMGHYHLHGRKFEAWLRREGEAPRPFYETTLPEPPWMTYTDVVYGGRQAGVVLRIREQRGCAAGIRAAGELAGALQSVRVLHARGRGGGDLAV
ncbi:MAG: hypothetical protein R3F14_12895 [Polyangiaceae bacterium]